MPQPNVDSLPSHASPVIAPQPRPSAQYLSSWADLNDSSRPSTPGLPANLISPAFTPPLTPSLSQPGTPSHHHSHHEPKSVPVDTSLDALDPSIKKPRLLQRLPQVECLVRARIPTTTGAEMFLHLYSNDTDNKEHLAIVFGNTIRSRSLDAERPGETEFDRMVRGAYTGRLRPGRTSSRRDDEEDLRRKVLRPDMKSRKRSGSALKNVESVPADPEQSDSQPEIQLSASGLSLQDPPAQPQDEQNSENTPITTSTLPAASLSSSTKQQQNLSIPLPPAPSSGLSTPSSVVMPPPPPSTPSISSPQSPLVRIHSECYTGETTWSARCDCGEQLDEAARLMSTVSTTNPDPSNIGGVIVYLRQEGRGIGLASKLKAYNLQDLGSDTVEANLLLRHPADARTYGLATAILVDLGLGTDTDVEENAWSEDVTETLAANKESSSSSSSRKGRSKGIRLLTNNPDKVRAVEGPSKEVRVVERVAMVPISWRSGGEKGVRGEELSRYLETKVGRMGHMIHE